MTMRRATITLLLAMWVSGCTCGGSGTPTGKDPMRAGSTAGGQKLEPLPAPPAIDVKPEALAGAGQALAVVASRPQGEWSGPVRPTVTFSRPVKSMEMVETQRAADAATPFARLEPALAGEWRWLGSSSAEFVPSGLAPMSTTFKVTVLKGLKALDGAALPEDFTFTFSTPTLQVQDTSPPRNFRWLAPDAPVRVLFNQPVKDSELAAHARFVVEGEAAPFKVQVMERVSIAAERKAEREKAAKEGGSVEPLSDDERGFGNQQHRYTLAPERPFPPGRQITLELDGALHGEQGALPLKRGDALTWRTFGPLTLTSASFCEDQTRCPYGPLVVRTSNELDLASLKAKLRVTPAVQLDWDAATVYAPHSGWEADRAPTVTIPGKFRPGTSYQIAIAPGATDVFKQADAKGLTAALHTDDLGSAILPGPYLGLLEAGKDAPRLPVEVSNLQTLKVKMWKVAPDELSKVLRHNDWEETAILTRAPDFTEDEALSYPRNHGRVHPLQLAKVLGPEARTGLVLVSLDSPQAEVRPKTGYNMFVQVTDLAAHLKVGPKSSVAWVTRLSTGQPVEGASVVLYDEAGASRWTGATNAEGFVDLPGAVDLELRTPNNEWQVPYVLAVVQKDGDVSATANTWASGVEPYEFGLSSGWEGERPDNTGFLFTDRGIYRPGDTVYLKGVVRYRVRGELRAPQAGSSLSLTVTDSQGAKVKEQVVTVSSYGTFSLEVPTSKDQSLGTWTAQAEGQVEGGPVRVSGSFRVEEFRPLQFRVDVAAKAKDLLAGDPVEATISARYLYGGAMSDAALTWAVNRESTTFTTETAPDFSFQQETWWWDDRHPEEGSSFFGSGSGRVDGQGDFAVKAGAAAAPGGKPWRYTLEAEVTDVNRQAVAGRVEYLVHPAAAYVGLRSTASFLQVGTEYPLDTVVVDPRGKRVAGRPVAVSVVARTWTSVKKKTAGGGFETVSEPQETEVHTCALTSVDGSTPCRFKPAAAGFYIVKASVKDEQGRQHQASLGVYATGADWVAWQRNDTDRIELVTDKPKYDVGDVARVLIKSPYPEAKAMFTVEREGVLERRLLDLKGSVVTVEVPITEAMVPNVFAGVVLMRPRVEKGGLETGDDPGRPNARLGLVKLNVERKSKRLAVEVQVDQKEYRPRDPVKVDLTVKDAQGKPTTGEVTLYVVDEAVLRITSYETPDPIGFLFPERPLSVRIGEPLLHLVRRRSYGEKGEGQGGGGGGREGSGIRNQFKTTVVFQTLEARDGHATATFNLPDNLTTFRVMAVVVTNGDRFGSGETSLKVNKPVMALPALPRFARVGDHFEAGVVVHARGAGAGDITVTAQVKGPVKLDGPAEQKVTVKEGSPREVRFPFTATAAGTAAFTFRAVNGSASDGVEEKIPVILPVEIDAVAVAGDTTDQRVEGLTPPKDARDDVGGLTVSLASTSLGGFASGFQQLVEYPYGCLEQQASRLVPFVALREISGQFGVPWPGADPKKLAADARLASFFNTFLFRGLDVSQERNPDAVVAKTVKSLIQLQDDSGAFRYWPDAMCPTSWGSAYATLALTRASEVGFEVPADRLLKAEANLSRIVGGKCSPCERSCDDETRVFAASVLAQAHRPHPSAYGELYARREKLSLFGRALLAHAMFTGGGNRQDANALLQELLNQARESAKGVHLEEINALTGATYFQSDTRSTAVTLQALTSIQPDHPYVGKMARYLQSIRQGNGEWRSTQEAAFSLLALTQVLRTKEKDVPDFKAAVTLGATSLVDETFQGRSLDVRTREVPMAKLLEQAQGKAQPLSFQKQGAGVLSYTATMRYATKTMPTQPLDSGLFVQRWFEPLTGGGQATRFAAGELVRLRVRVASAQERHWTAFEVPLPAGLEVVDTSLATSARLRTSPEDQGRDMGSEYENGQDGESGNAAGPSDPWAYAFWSPFTHTEIRDDRVLVFADHLPPGVHLVSFVARATTPGTYVLQPARGTLMYEPETWGRSGGGTFEVVLPTTVSQK